ncbi:MAG: ester cyclase [Pseudomonadota bacterium]
MSDLQPAKDLIRGYYGALAEDPVAAMVRYCAPDLLWRGLHPFHEITGPEAVADRFWLPLAAALQPIQRRLDLFFAGQNTLEGAEGVWVASMGHLLGFFRAPWLGIRPSGKLAMLRYAAFHRVEEGRIAEEALFFDIPHLMIQAEQNPFPPQTAAHLVQPGPMTQDGLLFDAQDPAEGAATLGAITRMIADLQVWQAVDGPALEDELRRSWSEDMLWWGPAGIGAAYTIPGYAAQHAGPFRRGFAERRFNGHLARFAEGHFGGFFGWPNLTLTPSGGFMGMPATGRPGDMRVVDMYRRAGDKLAENWIFIDLLHFWAQLGLDVLGRHRALGESGETAIG